MSSKGRHAALALAVLLALALALARYRAGSPAIPPPAVPVAVTAPPLPTRAPAKAKKKIKKIAAKKPEAASAPEVERRTPRVSRLRDKGEAFGGGRDRVDKATEPAKAAQ